MVYPFSEAHTKTLYIGVVTHMRPLRLLIVHASRHVMPDLLGGVDRSMALAWTSMVDVSVIVIALCLYLISPDSTFVGSKWC